MIQSLKPIIILLLTRVLFAQFQADIPIRSLPANINGQLNNHGSIFSFDSENLDVNYGFTMSMMSMNGQSFSVAGFNNNISYALKKNLIVDANFTLSKSKIPFQQHSDLSSGYDLSYNAGLTYKPSENSFLQFRIQKIPFNDIYRSNSIFHNSVYK
jgi:hypothetical protein